MSDPVQARELWERLETVHAVTYFALEPRQAATDAGLRGFWMGYFGFRASPLGRATAEDVTDAFANFALEMVQRAIPDAWSYAEPGVLVDVRAAAAAAALRSIDPGIDAVAEATNPALAELAAAAGSTGPLAAANASVALPDDPVARLWQLTTCIREHRGDAHVAALRAREIDGCASHVLQAARKGIPSELLQSSRGWDAEDWSDAESRLRDRGLLRDGVLTGAGADALADVELDTDRASAELLSSGSVSVEDLLHELDGSSVTIAGSGIIPYPNPMGLPDVRRR